MGTQRVLIGTTTTIVTYPRVEDGDFVVGVPSAPEVRIGTPAVSMPSEDDAWPTATVDDTLVRVTVAAVAGDTDLTVSNAYDDAFDVATARAVVSGVLQGLGTYSEANADADALVLVPDRLTVTAFEVLIEEVRGLLTFHKGSAITDGEVASVVAAFASIAEPAAAAWVKGRRYLLVDGDQVDIITAARSGSALHLAEPLERAVSTAALVKGWAITKALTALQTANVGGAVAVFRAVVDGVTLAWTHPFRIVRRVVVIPLTGVELVAAYPVVHSLLPPTQTREELIEAGWEYKLLPTLLAKNVREDDIVDPEVLRPLLALACVVHLFVTAPGADPGVRESVIADYERLTLTTFARADWHDAGQDAEPPRVPDPTQRRRGIRMVR